MKRKIIPTLALLVGLAACDTSVLDVSPKDQISDKAVFADPNLATAFLNDIYIGMGHGLYEVQLSSVVDEAQMIHTYGTDRIVQATVSPSDRGAFTRGDYNHWDWDDLYFRIRQTNVFLSQIDDANFDPQVKERLKGQAYFLRAYFYHNLLRIYGGVPLITKVYGLNEDYEIARSSFEETVNFVVANADSAAALLPVDWPSSDLGRATKGAALALKARTLLYAASDLYHVNPSGMPETGYTTSQDRRAFWQAAKDAAKAVMDLGIYGLYRPNPADTAEARQNYADLFLQQRTEETILNRYFLVTRGDGYHPGLHNGPNGYHNWGGNTPLQNLVDDYRMADGSKFDWNNPAHAAAPYENREPRFYASILFDGAPWRERPEDAKALDPYNIIQTFTMLYVGSDSFPGLDTRKGPIENWNGAYSGYYLRKFIDPNVNHQFVKQEIPWPFFRYTEILLNYAEACIELGDPANLEEARGIINQIRRRAGLPELPAGLTQAQLREEYRAERRVEMAFEEQRYFDVRRWMIAPDVLNKPAYGIEIRLQGDSRTDRSTWRNYEYKVVQIQDRRWDDKLYFQPIPFDEIQRNSLLTQNPGY